MGANEENTCAAWSLARQLVQIDSSDPGAYEGVIGQWLKEWIRRQAEKWNIPVKEEYFRLEEEKGDSSQSSSSEPSGGVYDRCLELKMEEVLPGRCNLMARISGTFPGPGLIFICHMDTVTLGEGWDENRPPLGAVVEGKRMYGRGACDMKSGLACALMAFSSVLRRIGETGRWPGRSITLIGSVDEEDFMRGVEKAIKSGWVSTQDWILDTEPTDGQIQVAHKGRTWFELTIEGATAHASTPWKGADAVAAMSEAVCHIRRSISRCPVHHELGRSTVTFGQIEGGYRPYVVPDSCKVWIDMRLTPPTDTEKAKGIVEEAIRVAGDQVPGTRGSYVITGDRPYIERDDKSALLKALKQACRKATGEEAAVGFFNGYTDTAVIAGKLENHNCMSYGPGNLEMAHKPNEYVDYEDVDRCQRVLEILALETAFGEA